MNIEKVLGLYKLEDSKLMEMTQKKAYKIILRHQKRQSSNNLTNKKMEDTRVELFQKTGTCITINKIWANNKKNIILPR